MQPPLDAVAVRVLGSLIEKESTTPDNYPLTLNALVAACNQTSNRDPVMSLDEATVASALAELSRRGLAREVHRSDSRAKRYRQTMSEALSLHPAETAAMCVLMLRGAQTPGEIRTRAARLFDFADVARVELTLEALMTMSEPLVAQLPRRPGQKELRYAHLLSGEPDVDTEPAPTAGSARADRLETLEQVVEGLCAEVAELRAELEAFRREFQ
ncbi:MAG TPA: YceH family protein [Longimicrobiales bacterium]|nr:YceH family protein [Longimicrobiales bacterium]